MTAEADVLSRILSADALKLGWLVLDKKDPRGDSYLQTMGEPIHPREVISNDWKHKDDESNTTGFKLFLSGLLKIGLRLKKGVSIELSALRAVVSTMEGCNKWFEDICGQDDVRRWIEERVDRRGPFVHIWLVTGLHIAEGVKLQASVDQGLEVPLEAMVPLTALLGDPGILGQVLGNPGAGVDIARLRRTITSFEVKDMIYAVQYRRLKIRFFGKSEKYRLGKNPIWEILTKNAGAESEPKELIEVSLEDGFNDDDNDNYQKTASSGAIYERDDCDSSSDDEEESRDAREAGNNVALPDETFFDPDTGEKVV